MPYSTHNTRQKLNSKVATRMASRISKTLEGEKYGEKSCKAKGEKKSLKFLSGRRIW